MIVLLFSQILKYRKQRHKNISRCSGHSCCQLKYPVCKSSCNRIDMPNCFLKTTLCLPLLACSSFDNGQMVLSFPVIDSCDVQNCSSSDCQAKAKIQCLCSSESYHDLTLNVAPCLADKPWQKFSILPRVITPIFNKSHCACIHTCLSV